MHSLCIAVRHSSIGRQAAASGDARIGQKTEYGQNYEVGGTIEGPLGKSAEVASVWIILEKKDIPRFVTSFPGGKR